MLRGWYLTCGERVIRSNFDSKNNDVATGARKLQHVKLSESAYFKHRYLSQFWCYVVEIWIVLRRYSDQLPFRRATTWLRRLGSYSTSNFPKMHVSNIDISVSFHALWLQFESWWEGTQINFQFEGQQRDYGSYSTSNFLKMHISNIDIPVSFDATWLKIELWWEGI